jgi:hypothetical protein
MRGPSLRLGLAVGFAAAFVGAAVPAGARVDGPDLRPYGRLGTWIDIYSPGFQADPSAIAAALARHGVGTLFLETGNYRQRVDLVRPQQLGRLIDAAHSRGIAVVAWYLPSLTNPTRDLRRSLAAARFVSSRGERFDSFALDIESSAVADVDARNRRLLALSARLRSAVGPTYPLGAIIPSPVGMKLLPRYWPGFPFAAIARTYDVLLPMAYYSYRAHGSAAVARYVRTSVAIIRAQSGDPSVPIHVIGGLANATGTVQAAAFLQAVAGCGVRGFSLYDFFATRASVWPLLTRAASAVPVASTC